MIEIDRYYLGLMMEAGYILLGMQRFKKAREVFEGIAVMAPDSDIPLVALGSVEFCEGKFAQAVKTYKKALKKNSDSIYADVYMAEALFFMKKKDEAIKKLKDVLKRDSQSKSGEFAGALLDAIKKGFDPDTLSGHKEVRAYVDKKEKSRKKG